VIRNKVTVKKTGIRKTCLGLILLLSITGCGSRVVQLSLINISQQPLKTIIVDYPGATFGKDLLPPGATFQYKIKPLETGPLKIQFTDAQGHTHSYSGPTLHKNDEGGFEIRLTQDSATTQAVSFNE
jgi:hypothetical protein